MKLKKKNCLSLFNGPWRKSNEKLIYIFRLATVELNFWIFEEKNVLSMLLLCSLGIY